MAVYSEIKINSSVIGLYDVAEIEFLILSLMSYSVGKASIVT